ncbi:MAG: hypothetical protein A2629_03115 [Candidatus Levybacteria bacterium RIFCSPHIGHO2_01_FULL_41_15]|nr:MAG: hypothetical protein A2629_03115 [Candidatus Levybacteria bacterium RIFCSPHIGHO2_01_FULL_41_15]
MRKSSILNHQPSIYILHGWTYSLEKWSPFIAHLKQSKLNPVLLKIPGLTKKIENPWTLEDYVDWLFNIVKNETGSINLIGHSNGGRIAMAFALKYQDKISKLVLIDSAGVFHDKLPLKVKRVVFKAIAKTGRKFLSSKTAKNLLYFLARETDYKDASENMKKTMINLMEADKTLEIEKILASTIIIWGRKDSITPLSDAKILNQKIINSKLYIINNARHSPQFTNPEETAGIISNFL